MKEVPDALVIYLTEQRDPIKTRDVNRAGVFDILFLPEEIHALPDVLNRASNFLENRSERKKETANFSWGRGQVISFYSGKGGSGRSLVSSTLAQTIGLDSNSSVLLVDLNLQFGGVETYLDVEHDRSIADLTPVLHELNDNHIRNVTSVEQHSQAEILISPADAEIGEQITEEHVARLLRSARLYYDYILVDLPTDMNSLSFTALEEADRIFYVMTPDSPAMRVLGTVLELFEKIGVDPQERLELLINRKSRDTELSVKDITRHFPFPVIGELREDAKKVQQLINRGKLLRTSRKERGLSIFARDVQKLALLLLKQQDSRTAS